MLIKRLKDIRNSNRNVTDRGWESSRLLLAEDGMGFSFHITTLAAGGEWTFHYRHHVEAVYVVSGDGSVEDLATGERHVLEPGTLYALNDNDRHTLRADTELVTVCVFNPPVTGAEVHDETGAYRPAPAP
ncbi:ectoine synthase [Novosphingobium album (ex Liu et al. 2023)]|uniref:L-ectoine synthase n=1 Tax=Novosphingobium album (ex Liu et al. 2023) TaxID=3031130 RepID=A0ABT5WXU2_9SPHN|nr:ectoine synthase [Novosphingobium album (ex Liu et al. 2023)]MDE8654689.1 ectoine synthase [Novosphingobium album (ex Liu et al. 2023)]